MKIHNIKVRGAIGFKKGLGVDEIDLDLSNLSGLIALAGPNGHGKTTLLESLSPFRTFASRSGALRHHFFLRDSFRDISFEYSGDLYRTLVKIDADTDRSEGFVWKNNQPQVDGKVTNYNNYLVNLLGTANLFYNSVFCAQNSAKISDMTTGQLKQLFVEFLRLDRLAGYEKTSKQCVAILGSLLGIAERRGNNLEERLERFQDTDKELEDLRMNETGILSSMETTKQSIIKTEVDIHVLIQTSLRNDDLNKELSGIRENIALMQNSADRQKVQGTEKEAYFNRETGVVDTGIRECENILKDRDEIEKASDTIVDIDGKIDAENKQLDELAGQRQRATNEYLVISERINKARLDIAEKGNSTEIQAMERAGRDMLRDIDEKVAKIDQLRASCQKALSTSEMMTIESEIKSCRNQMLLLDQRDPACQSETCSFILAGLGAKKQLPELEAELERLTADGIKAVEDIEKQIKALEAEVVGLKSAYGKQAADIVTAKNTLKTELSKLQAGLNLDQENLTAIAIQGQGMNKDIEAIDAKIKALKEQKIQTDILAKKRPQLEVSVARNAELIRQRAAIEDERKAWFADHGKKADEIQGAIKDLQGQLVIVEGKIIPNIDEDLKNKRTDLETFKKDLTAYEKEITDLRTAISKHVASLEERANAQKELEGIKAEIASLKKDMSEWTYLRNSCGKTGLQALEIDGVAPMVTGYANDLLSQSFGPNFSVKLVTQDPETGKEVLDIVVLRGDGSETLLENLSGGEKVWILKSIRLAMTLVSKEKSGRNFQSFFSDEEDGALDGEKALNFVGLYRSLMTTGGFDTCYYISHNPDVVAMADHQIRFSREGIKVA
ncbi:SMC family ATPase [Desulfobacula sp.]|uniref:SMC family ATPase n=1 Tax=Desulfobacula sp. TaxID=2593537 RepID=UPI00262CDCC0|nr:SMC family ATPase [Desulfobacula sp.]